MDSKSTRRWPEEGLANGLSPHAIRECLRTRWLGQAEVCCFDVVESTNMEANRLAREGAPNGTVIVANAQTKGRGRLGRSWISPRGSGLYLSIILRPQCPPDWYPRLALIAGVGVASAIQETGVRPQLKWPNDILLAGRKVGGILTEAAFDASRIGLWGISQAGWVMPKALDQSGNVAFTIVVSGGGEASPEQMAYQIGQQVACGGGSAEEAALVERYWAQSFNATTYDAYREAMEVLIDIPRFEVHTGITLRIAEEGDWRPYRRDTDRFFDPIEVIEQTTFPVLAFFGALDKNIDPVQGAEAYEAALQKAGNQDYQVVIIPGVAHTLAPAETGCIGEQWGSEIAPEYLETMEAWLQDRAP